MENKKMPVYTCKICSKTHRTEEDCIYNTYKLSYEILKIILDICKYDKDNLISLVNYCKENQKNIIKNTNKPKFINKLIIELYEYFYNK